MRARLDQIYIGISHSVSVSMRSMTSCITLLPSFDVGSEKLALRAVGEMAFGMLDARKGSRWAEASLRSQFRFGLGRIIGVARIQEQHQVHPSLPHLPIRIHRVWAYKTTSMCSMFFGCPCWRDGGRTRSFGQGACDEIVGVQARAVVDASPSQGLLSLLVPFPSGHSSFLLRVLVNLSGRVCEKLDGSYCFWLSCRRFLLSSK